MKPAAGQFEQLPHTKKETVASAKLRRRRRLAAVQQLEAPRPLPDNHARHVVGEAELGDVGKHARPRLVLNSKSLQYSLPYLLVRIVRVLLGDTRKR